MTIRDTLNYKRKTFIKEVINEANETIKDYLVTCLSDSLNNGECPPRVRLALIEENNEYKCIITDDYEEIIFKGYKNREFALEIFYRLIVYLYDQGIKCSIIESSESEIQTWEIILE